MSDDTIKKVEPLPLTVREQVALSRWQSTGKPLQLSASKAVEFYSLYMNGSTCEQIHELNPSFDLGLIVQTKVNDEWDRRLADHREALYRDIRDSTRQLQAEAIVFTADMIRVSHKLLGSRLKRFLQTGDEKTLEGLKETFLIKSQKQYGDAIELLLKLTGQDRESKVHHEHEVIPPAASALPAGPLSPEQASMILAAMERDREVKI